MMFRLLKMLGRKSTPATARERYPFNVAGDFYVENGCCMTCGLAEAEAPDLIESLDNTEHCYFKKQPETPEELERAIMAMLVSEVGCHRYGGTDEKILRRLKVKGLDGQCDFPLSKKH